MPSVIQPAEFFVVGGPVPPDRSCYVERTADRRLAQALRAKRLCCVLGPRAIGKSSLLRRAGRSLRAAGTLVANVDLRGIVDQLGDERTCGLRRVAKRVAAELELEVDVDAWWEDRDAIDENGLVEFFWEIVLTNTTAPIVVLVDDVDAALDLPLADDFLDAVAACYERRSREPDFARLSFALAGRASQGELADDTADSAFADAEIIEPADFDAEQAYRLAVAFGGDELSQALMDRICAWTGGQPYLTQRVARGVARRGGGLEDVERAVREQFLAPGAADKDPLLADVRAWLGEASRPARRATKLLHRLVAGAKVSQPADAEVWERLWLSGAVRVDAERRLGVRNRIVKELVAAGWLKQKTGAARWLAVAAALLVAVAGGGYWYTQYLPVADIGTLTSAATDIDDGEQAYRRLRGLPGFTERADALWLEALRRHSERARTVADAAAADTRLRELPGQDAAADRLLSDFWLRRAREQAHAEQRDAAILLAQRAAALPAADPAAVAYLAELAGDDYTPLERSLRLTGEPEYWHMVFPRGAVVSIDAQRQALSTPFGASAGDALGAAPLKLTALEHRALTRELAVEGEGTAGELELSLIVQHASAGELLVTLTAPSGAAAAVAVPRGDGARVETFTFQAAQGSPLALLADEGVSGVWRLTIVDRVAGNTGVFGGWGLVLGEQFASDDPSELVAIPDPQRVDAVEVQAVADRAVAWPTAPGVVGTVALWNLTTGQLEHDYTLPAAPRQVALDATGTRVLAATDRLLMLWNADGALVARVGTQTEFVLPPVFSTDGGYVAIAERVDGANPLYSVLRSADASLVASIEGVPDVEGWELGPGGRYVALQGPDTLVRVLETRRGGAELGRLAHTHAVERLLHSPDGTALLTVDRLGAVAAWPLSATSVQAARPLGRTAAAASVSTSADGRRLAFTRADGAVAVLDVAVGTELYRLRLAAAASITATQLSDDGTELVTRTGDRLRLWSLPAVPVPPRGRLADGVPTVVALDRSSELLAVGLASGQLQLELGAAAANSTTALAFFGHRGPITAAALNAGRNLAATGGSDGIVRVWDTASGAPTVAVMQPAEGAVTMVALSDDGRSVASAAERVVRIAAVADGRVLAELRADGVVTALAFAPDGVSIAVGTTTGTVVLALAATGAERASVRLGADVTSLAFTPDGSRLAVGDASGTITLLATSAGNSQGSVRHWSAPIRWLEFSRDGSALLAATDAWVHALAAMTPALEPFASKLVAWPAAGTVRAAISATSIGFAGIAVDGSLRAGVLDLTAAPVGAADTAALVARDWTAVFALRLNDNGEPVPFDP